MLAVHQLLAFNDNYIHLLLDEASGEGAVIDPGDAAPVLQAVERNGWKLTQIWTTHHHADHAGGTEELKAKLGLKVFGAAIDAHRLPGLDVGLKDQDELRLGEHRARALFVPGHTSGHLAYWFDDERMLFPGDTLFAMGCGRLFEEPADVMWASLSRLKNLPGDTLVYCAHEYTLANGRFAKNIEPENESLLLRLNEARAMRDKGLSTVPFRLDLDLATNPFLRAGSAQAFAELRRQKDVFK
ncbi:Hydroxyacylglutathione hydrolase [Rhodospirillaceae bacterium LM-1]|nr:Hydroxyacylglutathione hydrolase [Rhodospirillaceae bacterium LM-1]